MTFAKGFRHVSLRRPPAIFLAVLSDYCSCRVALKDVPACSLLIVLLLLVNSYFQQNAELKQAQAALASTNQKFIDASGIASAVVHKESEISSLKATISKKDEEISAVQQRYQASADDAKDKSSEVVRLNSQIATLKEEVKAASAAATEKESEISRLSGEVAGFQSQLTSMTEELERAQQAKS